VIKIHLPGVTMNVRHHADHLEVTLLIVRHEHRNSGLGTSAILGLQQFGLAIRLTAIPEVGKKSALHRFYRRLGFCSAGRDAVGNTEFEWLPKSEIVNLKS